MTLDALQRVLGERKQRLAIDAPAADRTTIGALVARNGYGPLRTRYGTLKDVVVGMTIVRADGCVARGGGKVVKNVAGFDIPKLMIGTYGTLAIVATVTFRLHPLPKAQRRAVVHGCTPAEVERLRHAIVAAQLEPSAMTASFDGDAYRLDVLFEGFERGVEAQRARFDSLAAAAGADAADSGCDRARTGAIVVKISALPSLFETVHREAVAPVYRCLRDAAACAYPSVGIAFVSGDPHDIAGALDALTHARTAIERLGGSVTIEEAPPAVRGAFDPWGTPPSSFPLMRALKERFDPHRLLQPGGFVGGL
jgi:glycolate oxidase FAD binding subunit